MQPQTFTPTNRPIQKPTNHPSIAANNSTPNQAGAARPMLSPNQNNNSNMQAQSDTTDVNQPPYQPMQHRQPMTPKNEGSNGAQKPVHNPFKKQNNNEQPNRNAEFRQIYAHGYKVHGGKAALEVKPDTKQKEKDEGLIDENGCENVFHTIRLEGAKSNQRNDRTYDWANKIALQLTDIELPLFIGVCLGLYPKIEFGNHGIGSDKSSKSFSVEFQKDKIFFTLTQKDKPLCPVPVNLVQANHIGLLALEVYCRNFTGLNSQTVLDSIKNVCSMYMENDRMHIKDRV